MLKIFFKTERNKYTQNDSFWKLSIQNNYSVKSYFKGEKYMLLVLDRLQSDGYFSEPIAMPAVGHAILDFLIPLKCSMIEIQKHLACGQEKKK